MPMRAKLPIFIAGLIADLDRGFPSRLSVAALRRGIPSPISCRS
jgi:hypothetical protein